MSAGKELALCTALANEHEEGVIGPDGERQWPDLTCMFRATREDARQPLIAELKQLRDLYHSAMRGLEPALIREAEACAARDSAHKAGIEAGLQAGCDLQRRLDAAALELVKAERDAMQEQLRQVEALCAVPNGLACVRDDESEWGTSDEPYVYVASIRKILGGEQ